MIAVDLETSCGVEACPGYGLSNSSKCEHALHFKLNKIDIIGSYDGITYRRHQSVADLDGFLLATKQQVVFHGGKFDYKVLKAKGSCIAPHMVLGDTQLLAAVVEHKIPLDWLKSYNEKRKELNEHLPAKQKHRVGTPLSLKTLAPYYLGVTPFWENPVSHDDPEYNRLDCEYTHRLYEKLVAVAEQDGTLPFYTNYLVPWQKLLVEAELEGVLIDEKLLHKMYTDACAELVQRENALHELLGDCFGAYRDRLAVDARIDMEQRLEKYCETRLKNKSKRKAVTDRYEKSLAEEIAKLPQKFNLASSQQMLVILNYFGIDTNVEKRDKESNEWIEKEGTDKFVLKRAKVRGTEQAKEFAAKVLAYREKETEVSYLKQYIEACVDGRIYCNFSIVGTRTGRLSSSGPNLQNVKGSLRRPFIIADPERYSIYTVDSAQIEPRMIAYATGDEEMVKLFQAGRSYHNYAAPKFFPSELAGVEEAKIKHEHPHLYKSAKIGDLSIIYGTSKHTFQTMLLVREEMDIPLERCDQMVRNFRAGLQGPMAFKQAMEENYKRGVKIFDMFGFLVQARDKSSVHMTLFNTYIQGMSSRAIFHASLGAFREFCKRGIDAKPLIWVHDEVVWRFPKGMEQMCQNIVDRYMTGYRLNTQHGPVPLGVEGKVAGCWEK